MLNFLHVGAQTGSVILVFITVIIPTFAITWAYWFERDDVAAAYLYFSVVKLFFAFSVLKRKDQVLTIYSPISIHLNLIYLKNDYTH